MARRLFKELVNDYADAVYSSMFSGLDANRNWLTKADFLLVVDAGVVGHFPSELLDGVPQLQLERKILQAVEIQEGSYFLEEPTNFEKLFRSRCGAFSYTCKEEALFADTVASRQKAMMKIG